MTTPFSCRIFVVSSHRGAPPFRKEYNSGGRCRQQHSGAGQNQSRRQPSPRRLPKKRPAGSSPCDFDLFRLRIAPRSHGLRPMNVSRPHGEIRVPGVRPGTPCAGTCALKSISYSWFSLRVSPGFRPGPALFFCLRISINAYFVRIRGPQGRNRHDFVNFARNYLRSGRFALRQPLVFAGDSRALASVICANRSTDPDASSGHAQTILNFES